MSVGKKHYETKCPCQTHVVLDLLASLLLLQKKRNFHNVVSHKAWLAMGVTGLGGPLPSLHRLAWLSLGFTWYIKYIPMCLHTEPRSLHSVNLNTRSRTRTGGLYTFYKNYLIVISYFSTTTRLNEARQQHLPGLCAFPFS